MPPLSQASQNSHAAIYDAKGKVDTCLAALQNDLSTLNANNAVAQAAHVQSFIAQLQEMSAQLQMDLDTYYDTSQQNP